MSNIKPRYTMKELKTRVSKQEVKVGQHKEEMKIYQATYQQELDRLSSLKAELKKLEEANKDIIISEHAILRYLERGLGINLEDVKKQMLSEQDKEKIKVLGNCKYPVRDIGIKLVVKNNCVVSVV